jgi:2Fe-2S ferredoxin
MAGSNPYINAPTFEKPQQPYKLTIRYEDESRDLTVDPARLPYGRSGLPGSILDICEGTTSRWSTRAARVLACSTCHVYVKKGFDTCNEATDDELDQLEEAPGITMQSRLGCQCVPNGTSEVIIEVPRWNRNAVKETPHD